MTTSVGLVVQDGLIRFPAVREAAALLALMVTAALAVRSHQLTRQLAGVAAAVTAVEQALEVQHQAALQVQMPVSEEQEGMLRRVLLVVLAPLHRSIQEAVAAAQETVATPTPGA
jgi:hypothetical protein